ncbi:MAG: hypothetical protein ACYDAC_06250 [Candidatus Dormibacteria bacterium]
MLARPLVMTSLLAALLASGCASPAAATPTPSPLHRATPSPSASPPLPAGPYALLYTNDARTGTTYDVLVVDVAAKVVARVTAKLPLLKPNQTLQLPLVSPGATHAYYLDGDTQISALALTGTSTPVKTISAGTTGEIGFAVSPDEHSVAVAVITEQEDSAKSQGTGYVEDLGDAAGHRQLFANTGLDAYRWPVGWFGNSIIDGVDPNGACSRYARYGAGPAALLCVGSVHVIDATTTNRVASICEPGPEPSGTSSYGNLEGRATPSGIACYTSTSTTTSYGSPPSTQCSLSAVAWTGQARVFDACTAQDSYLQEGGCFLAPDGSRMACTEAPNQALTILSADRTSRSLGRRYSVLGWIDTTHLMVDIDSQTLGVVDVDSGSLATLAFAGADTVAMAGVIAGQ